MLFRNNSFVLLPERAVSAQSISAIPQQQDNKEAFLLGPSLGPLSRLSDPGP